jgi:alpha-N-arabinofuranosidase
MPDERTNTLGMKWGRPCGIVVWAIASLLALVCARAAEGNYTPLEPEVLMPDGSPFRTWADHTVYSKTYHVNQHHPRASDDNSGTADSPFGTINRAAQEVRPNERVWIHAGVYQELVQPRVSGESPDRMIAYEAAPGEEVTIKGSRVLEGLWVVSQDPNGHGIFSKKLWMIPVPDSLFSGGYFPFRTPNASDEEMDLMPWALAWKGQIPYTLPRGLVFQEGRRMAQVATYEDLARLPGSYWVGRGGTTIHIHPFDVRNPNGKLFEVAVQPHILKPQNPGLGFIRVSNLTLEHCANGFPRIGVGALFTMGGHHWIIEGNTVRHVNSVGIEMGYRTFEAQDRRFPRRADPDLGHTIVRGNRIYDCGTAGIRSHNVSYALIEHNDILGCGWQDVEFYWETAGIKLLVTAGTLVRQNRVGEIQAGCGIWLDWDNQNSRVTGNVIHDVCTAQAAVFVEASQVPNLVDHNVIWNIDGQGVRVADTDNLTVAHNLIGRTTEDLIFAKVATDRSLRGRRLTSTGNRVVNNIFFEPGKPIAFDPGNAADYNIYVSRRDGPAVKPSLGEKNSITLTAEVKFESQDLLLDFRPAQQLPAVPALPPCLRDFFGEKREGEWTVPGPFLAPIHPVSVRLGRDPLRLGN